MTRSRSRALNHYDSTYQTQQYSNGRDEQLESFISNADTSQVPLLLLHGFAQSKRTWDEFISMLPETLPVFCFDWPGHGDDRTSLRMEEDPLFFLDKDFFGFPYLTGILTGMCRRIEEAYGSPPEGIGYS
ncbi:MAG: alpha/beta fold hydrolase, partial [Eggerthellaceae bacterium]|nr:alpha/beta fold hydrolase [Eggerthellaceae bacterium]